MNIFNTLADIHDAIMALDDGHREVALRPDVNYHNWPLLAALVHEFSVTVDNNNLFNNDYSYLEELCDVLWDADGNLYEMSSPKSDRDLINRSIDGFEYCCKEAINLMRKIQRK